MGKTILKFLVASGFLLTSFQVFATTSEDALDDEISVVLKEIKSENNTGKRKFIEQKPVQKRKVVKRKKRKTLKRKSVKKSVKKKIARKKLPKRRVKKRKNKVIYTDNTTFSTVSTSETASKNVPGTYNPDKPQKWGVNIFAYYSSANAIQSTGNSSNSYSQYGGNNSDYESAASFGLGVEHSMELLNAGPVQIGYQAGATYEFERELTTNNNNGSYNGFYNSNFYNNDAPTLALILPYANVLARYKIGYAFGGINYSVPQLKSSGNESVEGRLGFQAGVGANIGKWMSAEIQYRVVGVDAIAENQGYDNFNYGNTYQSGQQNLGLAINQDETLDLNGFLVSVKVRF